MLDLFPKNFLDNPLFFSNDELDLLSGSYLKGTIKEAIESNEHDYGVLERNVPGFKESQTFDEYLKM